MPASAPDVIAPAFRHTIQQLLKPFRLGQWTRLAFVGLLAGELSSSGGSSFRFLGFRGGSNSPDPFMAQGLPFPQIMVVAAVALLLVMGVVLFIAFVYVNSMMRFVLFDSVVAKECHIRRFWAQRHGPGLRYFVWQLLFSLTMFVAMAILVGTAAAIVIGMGWFRNPGQHLVPLILGGILFFFAFLALLIPALVVVVLTKDFVVPQMAFEDISAVEGWRRLWSMMKGEKAGYAGYVGMKILLSLGAAILLIIAAFMVLLVLLIPTGALGLAAVLSGKAAGLTWNLATISVAVVAGCAVVAAILYTLALISVPMIVFFPAYSIYFFAERYPPLNAALHPPPA